MSAQTAEATLGMPRERFVDGLMREYGTERERAEAAADRVYGRVNELIDAMTSAEEIVIDRPFGIAGPSPMTLAEYNVTDHVTRAGRDSDDDPAICVRVVLADEHGKDEKAVEHSCDKLVLACAGRVVKFSHPGRTKQTFGIADRLYTFPRLGLHTWFEVKAPDGKQRPDQRVFEEDVTAGGMVYTLGGLGDLREWLVANGVVTGFNADGTPILPPRVSRP